MTSKRITSVSWAQGMATLLVFLAIPFTVFAQTEPTTATFWIDANYLNASGLDPCGATFTVGGQVAQFDPNLGVAVLELDATSGQDVVATISETNVTWESTQFTFHNVAPGFLYSHTFYGTRDEYTLQGVVQRNGVGASGVQVNISPGTPDGCGGNGGSWPQPLAGSTDTSGAFTISGIVHGLEGTLSLSGNYDGDCETIVDGAPSVGPVGSSGSLPDPVQLTTQFYSISGTVTGPDPSQPSVPYPNVPILVDVNQGTETYTVLTDGSGNFLVNGLLCESNVILYPQLSGYHAPAQVYSDLTYANYGTYEVQGADFDLEHVYFYDPVANAQYDTGDPIYLTWSTCSSCEPIVDQDLEFSSDGGQNWTTVVTDLPAELLQYDWVAPSVSSATCRFRLTIHQQNSYAFSLESPDFTVCNGLPTGTVTSPSSSDRFEVDDVVPIRVTPDTYCANPTLYQYYIRRSSGQPWEFLHQSNSTAYNWTATEPTCTNCRVKVNIVTGYGQGEVISAPFEIYDSGGCAKCDDIAQPPGARGDDTPTRAYVTRFSGLSPNPFNPSTTVKYELAEPTPVSIRIYNVRGELVRSQDSGTVGAGVHEWLWDGTDDSGGSVSSGTYFFSFSAGRLQETRKAVLLK